MRFWKYVAVAWAAAFMVGCNGRGGGSSQSGSGNQIVVGVVFDSGGLGDKSFNDSAHRGTEEAVSKLGIKTRYVESKSKSDYEPNLESLAESGAQMVIAVGDDMQDAVQTEAPKYPNVDFVTIDASVTAPNVRSLLFKEEEGSFLAGYLAGLVSKTGKIGFVGGEQIDLIKKFQYGYEAGAKTANPNVEMLPAKYTGNWDNVDDGRAAARVLFEGGADIVYSAAGRCGLGVIDEAKDEGKYAIGVDSDQDYVAPGHVLTSMIKHVDNAVFQTIQDLKDGKFTAGDKVYDLKAGGVGLSDMQYTKNVVGDANLAKLKAIEDDIISGKIQAPATEDQYNAYVASLSQKKS